MKIRLKGFRFIPLLEKLQDKVVRQLVISGKESHFIELVNKIN